MSIFNNVKELKASSELHLLIKLKHGNPNHSMNYLRSLPDSVISRAFMKIESTGVISTLETKRALLSILMSQPANKETTTAAVQESLIEYYTLYG